MPPRLRPILSVFAVGVWINASEFFRHQVLLLEAWLSHYRSLGMTIPESPVNGAVIAVYRRGGPFQSGAFSIEDEQVTR